MELKRQLGLASAVLIIIADMIGTGIFVITGSVLGITGSSAAVLGLWLLGGLTAVTGAISYSRLAALWSGNGGEYLYLKKIYGELPSFLTGWISLTVGFTASAAATALTLVFYLDAFWEGSLLSSPLSQKLAAAAIVVFFGLVHIAGVKRGSAVQNLFTCFKLLIVTVFILWGFAAIDWSHTERLAHGSLKGAGEYGLSLLIIMFAYSGWNGATYIAGEIKNPKKNLPRAMFIGTSVVAVLYFLLNLVYIMSSPAEALTGNNAVASAAAESLFGEKAAGLLSLGIALVLVSAVSVQMMVGPRVYQAMACDGMLFSSLARISPRFGTPAMAIAVQMLLAVIYVFIGRDNIDTLISYISFALGVFPLMSVAGLVIMRFRDPKLKSLKAPMFLLAPLVYILLSVSMMTASLVIWTRTSLAAVGILAAGIVIYYIWRSAVKKRTSG